MTNPEEQAAAWQAKARIEEDLKNKAQIELGVLKLALSRLAADLSPEQREATAQHWEKSATDIEKTLPNIANLGGFQKKAGEYIIEAHRHVAETIRDTRDVLEEPE